jgi:hypothetical protein
MVAALIAVLVASGGAGYAVASPTRVAAITPTSGAWVGKLSKYHLSKLTFKVSSNHKQIKGFATSVIPIVCGGGFSGPVTKLVSIGVSTATIKGGGTFQGKLVLHGTNGEESKTTLVGKFSSPKTASGKLTYKVDGCNVTEPFTAKKK